MSLSSELIARRDEALNDPKNEPINWLLGEALRQHSAWPASPHFLLGELVGPRGGTLTSWNAWIHQFRLLLQNPDVAPKKASIDLRSNGDDADEKLRALAAEFLAVLELRTRGFVDFEVVEPSTRLSTPDFMAKFEGKRVRIEAKNLEGPKDYIRSVAINEWNKERIKDAARYSFHATLKHSHRGALTTAAQSRLRNIIDQLPDMSLPRQESLDEGVQILLDRFDGTANAGERFMLEQIAKSGDVGKLIIVSSLGEEIFDFDVSELHGLFLKAIRIVVSAQNKFFGPETFDKESFNVITLRWEPPNVFWNSDTVAHTENRIESLFADFGLSLKVVIFHGNGPQVPIELSELYT